MKLKLITCLECAIANNEAAVFGVDETTSIQTLQCPYCKGNHLGNNDPYEVAVVRRKTLDERKHLDN